MKNVETNVGKIDSRILLNSCKRCRLKATVSRLKINNKTGHKAT